jgi:hypothetical protein
MVLIKVIKSDLVDIIASNCSDFGDAFLGIHVCLDGSLYSYLPHSCESFFIFSFSGMGDFTDDAGLYPDDVNYASFDVANHIVQNQECLDLEGVYTDSDGVEHDYKIVIED